MRKPRKGQIEGQVFVYILALIIFSAVLLYGYKAIKKFGDQSEELLITQLTNNIKSQVSKIESQYGSVEKLSLDVPEKYEKICFVDTREGCMYAPNDDPNFDCIGEDLIYGTMDIEKYPIICDAWKDCTGENLFLMSGNSAEGYNIGPLAVRGGFFCTDVVLPKTELRLEGKGDHAIISPW